MEKRFLVTRWLRPHSQITPIYDEASVSVARQRVRETGERRTLPKTFVESVVLMSSELTHNQIAHSWQGYFAVEEIERESVPGLEIVAADMGPGIPNPSRALKDNMPAQTGSLGAGLGAVARMADELEFDNRLSEGVCVTARKFVKQTGSLCCETAVMGRPFPGEAVSGDDAVFFQSEHGFLAAVSDGLGHGPEARQASNRALEALADRRDEAMEQLLFELNDEVSSTRGCALSIVRYRRDGRTLECASLGDVHCHLYHLRDAHFFTATPWVLGASHAPRPKILVETSRVEPGSILVMFTDGLKSRTTLKGQLDVLRQPAIAIAEHLLQNDSRPDDDALVLVARFL
jgi:anti-sigma regulatory factor (Ser/Thr protein kinase)